MPKTPQAAKTVSAALHYCAWQQSDLAEKSGIDRATVSHHLTGARDIRDDHLGKYCAALPPEERSALVAAWMRDVLPVEVHDNIFDGPFNKLKEDIRSYVVEVEPDVRSMLDWLAGMLARDPEGAEVFRILCRRMGYSAD